SLRVKNRMRGIRSSGSVRGGDGNIPAYSAQCGRNRSLRARGIVELVVPAIGVAHRRDRVRDVALGPQRGNCGVDNLRIGQPPGGAWWNDVVRSYGARQGYSILAVGPTKGGPHATE